MRRLLAATTVLAGLAAAPQASAAPVVHQNVTGSPGAWTVEYTIIHTDPADTGFVAMYFGINDPTLTPVSSPVSFVGLDPWAIVTSPHVIYNSLGPDTVHTFRYDTFVHLGFPHGGELDGFIATSTANDMPAYSPWVIALYGFESPYTGTPNYLADNNPTYPVFTGTAISTPEPASAALAVMGLLGLAAARRRRAA